MKETYEIGSGKTVTITVQVDDALSGDRDHLISELDVAVGTLKVREDQVTRLKAQLAQAERDRDTFKAQAYQQNDRAAGEKVRADRAEEKVAQLRREVGDYQEASDSEERRADDAERRVKHLEQSLAARDHLLREATEKYQRHTSAVRELLTSYAVREGRENAVTKVGAVLADAIGNALRVLDQA